MDKSEELKTLPIRKLIITITSPAIFSFIISTLNIAIDRIFIGQAIGTMALAAVTVALGIQALIQAVSQIIASGVSSAIALELGKNNKKRVNLLVGNAFMLSVIMSIVITFLGCVFIKPILKAYGANNECMEYAVRYTNIMIGSTFLFFLGQVMNNIIRGIGYAKIAMYNFLSSLIVNTCFDAIFLLVFHIGIRGAALSTALGYLTSSVLSIRFLRSDKSLATLKLKNIDINKDLVKMIISIGMPSFLVQIGLSIISLVFNHIANIYGGSEAVAAYGVVNTLIMIIYMPIMGLSIGIQSIVGINYGAGLYNRVKETVLKSIKYSSAFCISSAVIFEVFAKNISSLFSGDGRNSLIILTATGIRIVGISISLVGLIMVGANYFQYVGKAKESIFLVSLRQFILLVPLAIILPKFFGIKGMFAASTVSDIISFVVILMLFIKELRNLSIYTGVTEN